MRACHSLIGSIYFFFLVVNKTMMGLKTNGVLELRKYRIMPVLQIMRLNFRETCWLFTVTWLCCCCQRRLEEPWESRGHAKTHSTPARASSLLSGDLISKHITACRSHFSTGKGSSALSQDELQRESVPSSFLPTTGRAGVWLRPELCASGIKRVPVSPGAPKGLD